ncbi:MAG: hypothetical protein ACAH80_01975 [Alphaproteobacteria bacterium]
MKISTKKKILPALLPVAFTSLALALTGLIASIGGAIYYDESGSAGAPQPRATEVQEVENSFQHTKELKAEYEKYASRHKAQATQATPLAPEARNALAEQTLQAKYAYEASVAAQGVQLMHARQLSISEIEDGVKRLAKENGTVTPAYLHDIKARAAGNSAIHLCQQETAATAAPSAQSAEAIAACTTRYNNHSAIFMLCTMAAMIGAGIALNVLEGRWKDQIDAAEKAEKLRQAEALKAQKAQEALAASRPAPPPPPPPVFDPATGQAITVKPIRIKGATPAFGRSLSSA